MDMIKFKKFITEKLNKTIIDKISELYRGGMDKEDILSTVKKLYPNVTNPEKYYKDMLKGRGIKEDTEQQLQSKVVDDINIDLSLILKNSKKFQNNDFKKFFNNVSKEVDPVFSGYGFEVVKFDSPTIIVRSGAKDTGEENFAISADLIEFKNVELNVEWAKDENGFLLKNLKVRSK